MSAIRVQLAHLRAARGLTQQQLAERTGLRRDTISALERGKSRAIEFDTLARLCDALGVQASDILAIAPTAHVAPVLGGEDEDAIIEDRLAEAEAEIDALIADPARAAHALAIEDTTQSSRARSQRGGGSLLAHLEEVARIAARHHETALPNPETTAFHSMEHDSAKLEDTLKTAALIGIFAMKNGEVVAVPIEAEKWQATFAGSHR
jgi:putative transcriptional regulator